ncbi:MAG: hypothetical protein Q8S26_13355 [Azonexus sp.]|nr:hypothetical protein [Azonexus sp.]
MKVLATIAIGDAQPGMRVADAIVDDNGRVLVPAGCDLTDSILHGLARREIAEFKIERDVEEDPVDREARLLRSTGQLDELFRKAGEGSETRQLYQAILGFRLEQSS